MAVAIETNDSTTAWEEAKAKIMGEWLKAIKTNPHAPLTIPESPMEHMMNTAKWVPFATNMDVDLGPGDGKRDIWFGFKFKDPNFLPWEGSTVTVQTGSAHVVITNPTEFVTSRPKIEVRGYSDRPLERIAYTLLNDRRVPVGGGEGAVLQQRDFTCDDVSLDRGTNILALRLTDEAGNTTVTNLVVVFTTDGDTNPPAISIRFPTDGAKICGSEFTLDGYCDDPTAKVHAFILNDNGHVENWDGFNERGGTMWLDNMPLVDGTSRLTVVATDAATNSSIATLSVAKSPYVLYMDPVADPQQLWGKQITVTGYSSRTNEGVLVNGTKAAMKSDGHWIATNVLIISPHGSGATMFDIKTDSENTNENNQASAEPSVDAVWGAVADGLSLGVSLSPADKNQYNHYACRLYFTNSTGTNISCSWILPKEQFRYSFQLNGTNGKAIPVAAVLHGSNALPRGLNIHHLGKSELTNIDGVLNLPSNGVVCVASLNLDGYFHQPAPGDYRLDVRSSQLYHVKDDGSLEPFEFPSVSTTLKVLDQPSETTFYLNDLAKRRELFWNPAWNSMRLGIARDTELESQKGGIQIVVFLQNNSTNIFNLRTPALEQQYDISLYDAEGKEVPKTRLGESMGQPLKTNSLSGIHRSRELMPVYVPPKDAAEIESIDLSELFEIKLPGKYRLSYQQRLLQLTTNFQSNGITLPTVALPLDILSLPKRK